jgi:F0F1-type ATP synthase epsilon subunit
MAKEIPKLNVKIFSPYQIYYDGEATSVSATNRTGPFDVLAGHTNFFSLLSSGKVTVDTGFQKLDFKLDRGIIKVNANNVTLFANV